MSTPGSDARRPACARRPVGGRQALVLLALLASGAAGIAGAQPGPSAPAAPRTRSMPIQGHAAVRPAVAELGQRVLYQGWVLRWGAPGFARWLPPDTSEAFTWGEPTVIRRGWLGRRKGDAAARYPLDTDTLFVEIPLQAFALGHLSIPGLPVEIDDGRGPRIFRLPVVTLDVIPVLTAADSNADYRALHAPIAAPWWERVPWTWVALGLLLLAAAIVGYRVWRRRRRVAPAAAPLALPADPRAEALAAIAALRALGLPEHGRFAEHAFRLGQILRRYLEAVTGLTRPGDSTPELVAHLRGAGLSADDLARLSSLLRVWDRVKFAREPFTLDEAVRAERAVEAFVRRPPAPAEQVA